MKPCALCERGVRARVVAWVVGGGQLRRVLVCANCAQLGVLVISQESGDLVAATARRRKT